MECLELLHVKESKHRCWKQNRQHEDALLHTLISLLCESDELEDDMLDKAWGLEPDSRLSCQAVIAEDNLVVEIPKYTINIVSEAH